MRGAGHEGRPGTNAGHEGAGHEGRPAVTRGGTAPDAAVLVTVTGPDSPGVTAGLMDALGGCGARVLDVEQVVVHGRLLLGVALDASPDGLAAALDALELGVEVEVTPISGTPGRRSPDRHHVVLLADELRPESLAAVARRLAACGAGACTRAGRLDSAGAPAPTASCT